MIEPKVFYRKMDSLLNKIGQGQSGSNFLYKIIKEIENTFANDLKIGGGRIYDKNDDEFILVYSSGGSNENNQVAKILIRSESIQLVLKNKLYIFDDSKLSLEIMQNHIAFYAVPVAFVVENHDNMWMFVFELQSGWIREEIEFCLNAVRTLLNYRLFSESVKSELEQAVQIQKSLLPTTSPNIDGFQISGYSQPAVLVGGDFFDYFQFDEEEFGFYLGDASGHGIPAALMARDAVTGLRMGLEKQMKTVHILKSLNSVIYKSVYSTRFISLFIGEINTNGNLFYINAGHPSPILLCGDEVHQLNSTGLVIGALPEIKLKQTYLNITPGSTLILFSDGILERQNKKGENFGISRLEEIALLNRDKSSHEIMEAIFLAADDFGESSKWEDDATVLVIKKLK